MPVPEYHATVHKFQFSREELIEAPIEVVFEATLAELGPEGQMPDGKPMPMKLEAWPGGRLFRDLGNNAGHFWGNVQVIKPPTLLEIYGPMMMSYPVAGHLQVRCAQIGGGTLVTLKHRAIGLIDPKHREGFPEGWGKILKAIKDAAEK